MKKFFSGQKGFTLTEVMFVGVVTAFLVASVTSAWIFTHRTWSGERERTRMRIELLSSVEKIKSDLRLSSGDFMSFYPEDAFLYTAVMMPQATLDENGFFTVDANRKIIWDKTVFYHAESDGEGFNLVRTVVNSWDDDLDEDGRQQLLASLISGELDWDSREVVIDSYLKTFTIGPLAREVDFYTDSESAVRESDVIFGTVNVTPGEHTVSFVVSGKNDDSGGFSFGIDNVRIDPANSYREAEYYISELAPEGMWDSSGGDVTRIYDTVFSNHNYVEYSAAEEGDYIEFTDGYDLWRNSAFDSASFSNVSLYGEEVRAKMVTPSEESRLDENADDVVWEAFDESGADAQYPPADGTLPAYPAVFRNNISNSKIDPSGTGATEPVRADMVRVKIMSSSVNPLKIDSAYITRKDTSVGAADYDGQGNTAPGADDEPYEYHTHQQLFFKDLTDGNENSDSEEILAEAWVAAGSFAWSEWTAFPLAVDDASGNDAEYLLTIKVPDLEAEFGVDFDPDAADCRYFNGTGDNTYVISPVFSSGIVNIEDDRIDSAGHGLEDGDMVVFTATSSPGIDVGGTPGNLEGFSLETGLSQIAGTPSWSDLASARSDVYVVANSTADHFQITPEDGGVAVDFTSVGVGVAFAKLEPAANDDIYIVVEMDSWRKKGTVESRIFDTEVFAPSYDSLTWSEENLSAAPIVLKARSSGNFAMTGAPDWADVSGSSTSPFELSIDSVRYVQYLAEMVTQPYWEYSGGTSTYEDYVTEQVSAEPYVFPSNGGEYLVSAVDELWIDDVEINWAGEDRVCVLRADIAKKNDYGKVYVEFDGKPLSWGYGIVVSVEMEYNGRVFAEEKVFGIETKNTGS
ncbi:MAG TPA: hypothetical protein PKZ41_01325 [Candidatus Omnitrophota bacterium]|nr:hypothetical protein [Candidatus Omnitrophota bacterium]